jgi:uroporphyrinogen decarboxylase
VGLTHKERTRRAFRREPVDRLPTQINTTRAFGEKLAAHLDVSPAELPARLDNHLLRVDLGASRRMSADSQTAYDWWGAGWSTQEEGYSLTHSPLAGPKALADFPWPDPQAPDLLDEAAAAITADNGQHFIVPNFGFCLFERAWSLRGFETFLMDLALNPAFVEELLERITEIQVALAHRFVTLGVDGGYVGDDYGAQKHLLFSPQTWRALFKPRLARMFAVFREADLPVILHSDGDITEIVPDLVEIGVTVLNPVQPEVLDHAWLKRTLGDQLAFYGGVSTQTVLPGGSPAEVQAAVAACLRTLAGDGTGLLLGPSHRMMTDTPLENVDALLAAFAALREME